MYLYGNKVLLRALEIEDMEFLRTTANDPNIENMVGGWSFPISKESQMNWFNSLQPSERNIRYAIELLENKQFVGMISLLSVDWKNRTGMSAIKLVSDAPHGRGIATEAEKLLLDYCFYELNLNRITAEVIEYNEPSIALHKKVGYVLEGKKREAVFKKGKFHTVLSFAMLKSDYLNYSNNR